MHYIENLQHIPILVRSLPYNRLSKPFEIFKELLVIPVIATYQTRKGIIVLIIPQNRYHDFLSGSLTFELLNSRRKCGSFLGLGFRYTVKKKPKETNKKQVFYWLLTLPTNQRFAVFFPANRLSTNQLLKNPVCMHFL